MSSAPKRGQSNYADSPSGVAKIVLLKDKETGDKNLGVLYTDGDWKGEKFKVSEWPDYVKPKILPGKDWFVRLNSKKTVIFSISPIEGVFKGRCIGFAAKEGQPPVPKTSKPTKYGSFQYFTALVEIIEGDCKGMVLANVLRYNFCQGDDGKVEYSNWGSDDAVHSPKLH